MIKRLTNEDISQVARIHKNELFGFLPELGIQFLEKFYKESLTIPEMFTFVEKESDHILGFATGVFTAKGLYSKVISRDIIGFGFLLLSNIIVHPRNLIRMVKTLLYPGFSADIPELLTIAVIRTSQKKGIGRRLVKKIALTFHKKGIKQFRVSVYDRLPANGFYKKIGFTFDRSFSFLGERMNYYIYEIKNTHRS